MITKTSFEQFKRKNYFVPKIRYILNVGLKNHDIGKKFL